MPEMHETEAREQLFAGWKLLLEAGDLFDLFDLMGFIKKRVPDHDEALARHFVQQRCVEAGVVFPGRTIDPVAFGQARNVTSRSSATGLSVVGGSLGLRLVNPPHRQDHYGNAVAAAIAFILADRRNEEAAFWTLEAAQALAMRPCGLIVKYVLEWEVGGWDSAQLNLLADLEHFLRKTFDARFKVHPMLKLSPQAREWGNGHRRDFLVRSLPRFGGLGR